MAHDWRIHELVNQTLLVFAFKARLAILEKPSPLSIPSYSTILDETIREKLQKHSDAVPKHARYAASLTQHIEQGLDGIVKIGTVRDNIVKIARTAPWKLGDLVEWWINAGLVIAEWRSRDMAEANRRQVAVGAPRPAQAQTALIWNATVRRLRIEDDEVYPPLWCADVAEIWRLSEAGQGTRPESWSRDVTGAEDGRIALLEWCGDPSRERGGVVPSTVDAWADDYAGRHRDFARQSLRLLRRRCRFAEAAAIPDAARAAWRIASTGGSPSARRVLRSPLIAVDDPSGEPLVPGWVIGPWPKTLVEAMRHGAATRAPSSRSIDRALAAAAEAWRLDEPTFGPLPPWGRIGQSPDGRQLTQSLERLAAVARLLSLEPFRPTAPSADLATTPPDLRAAAAFDEALADEGFQWRRTDAAGRAIRRIPFGAGNAPKAADDAFQLSLARHDSDLVVDVGLCGLPARCGDGLLSAIEELDWRWWALGVVLSAGAIEAVPELARQFETFAWEPLKCRLLDLDDASRSPDQAPELAAAFGALHEARLALDVALAGLDDPSLHGLLAGRFRSLATTVLSLLKSIDPTDLGGLHPARTADTSIDLAIWVRDERQRPDPRSATWEIGWEQSEKPFGRQVSERPLPDGRGKAVFSAGRSATDDDLLLLDAIDVVSGPPSPADRLWLPLQARVAESLSAAATPDISAAIDEMRAAWSGDAAAAFDSLIKRAIAGDAGSIARLRVVQRDPRFRFECHPGISITDSAVAQIPATVTDPLQWQDADLPSGHDVEVFFATDPHQARRILSRGRPEDGSAEACAARLVAAIPDDRVALAADARGLRDAIDRRRLFGDAAPDPLELVAPLADALTTAESHEAWVAEAFRGLAACCRACGGSLIPAEWDPARGAPADAVDVVNVRFHERVPLGRVIVERFGVARADGDELASPSLFKSAGPEPPGYRDVVEKVALLPELDGPVGRLRQNVHDVPRRVEKGQAPVVGANLFDVAWEAKEALVGRNDVEDVVRAVHQFLERAYAMSLFQPEKVGDWPEGWLRTAQHGEPRGNRVDVVRRPGVKTRDNKLVRAAIVETE